MLWNLLTRLLTRLQRRRQPSGSEPAPSATAPALPPLTLRKDPYQMFVVALATGGFRAVVILDGHPVVYEDATTLFQAVMIGLYLLSVFTGVSAGKLYREWVRRHGCICPKSPDEVDAPASPKS